MRGSRGNRGLDMTTGLRVRRASSSRAKAPRWREWRARLLDQIRWLGNRSGLKKAETAISLAAFNTAGAVRRAQGIVGPDAGRKREQIGASKSSRPWVSRSSPRRPIRSARPGKPTARAVRISGRPSCARSSHRRIPPECTRLCGAPAHRAIAAEPNRWCASITSRPLFISVAESTESSDPSTIRVGDRLLRSDIGRDSRVRHGTALRKRLVGCAAPRPAPRSMAGTGRSHCVRCRLECFGAGVHARQLSKLPASTAIPCSPTAGACRRAPRSRRRQSCGTDDRRDHRIAGVAGSDGGERSAPACAWDDRPRSRKPSRKAANADSSAITAWLGRWLAHSAINPSTLLPAASTLARRR